MLTAGRHASSSQCPLATAEIPAAELARELEDFFAEYPQAAILEDGRVLFDMRVARYSLIADQGRCLLHLWSEERNLVRTICGLQVRKDVLRLETRRFGQTRPQVLELVPNRDRRTPSSREATSDEISPRPGSRARARVSPTGPPRAFAPLPTLKQLRPCLRTRRLLTRGTAAWSVIAVNAEETQPTIDGLLTLGILWLAYCREHSNGRRLFEGLKIIVPPGTARTTCARMPWLNHAVAKWELYEFDENAEQIDSVDLRDWRKPPLPTRACLQPEGCPGTFRLQQSIRSWGCCDPVSVRPRKSARAAPPRSRSSCMALNSHASGMDCAPVPSRDRTRSPLARETNRNAADARDRRPLPRAHGPTL